MSAPEPRDPATAAPTSPVTGFSHVQLRVADVARSRAWYEAVFDLEVLFEGAGVVALRSRRARFVVVLGEAAGVEQATSPIDHMAFAVPDGPALEAWAAHLAEVGIEHSGVVDEQGKPSLQLRDPDGNAVELVAPAPR